MYFSRLKEVQPDPPFPERTWILTESTNFIVKDFVNYEGFDDITLYRTKDKNKHRASPSGFHLIFENPKLASMLQPNRGEMKESQTTENVEVEAESFFLEDHSDHE